MPDLPAAPDSLWLQKIISRHFSTADNRLNYMPQAWGLVTLPLIQLAETGWSRCGIMRVGSCSYLSTLRWAFEVSGNVNQAASLAFHASTSTFAVLQGV